MTTSRVQSCKRRLYIGTITLLVCLGLPLTASAQDTAPAQGLLAAWLSAPALSSAPVPYQFLALQQTQTTAETGRRQLFAEFDELLWRLEDGGYEALVETVEEWREALASISSFRDPGYWDTAWLLSHPYEVPPLERVAVVGACNAPEWVELWDEHGVRQVDWSKAVDLSTLVNNLELRSGGDGRVIVIRPNGEFGTFGIEPWNFHNTALAPGSRIVAALPLGGEVFPWVQRSIARLLAYTPSGEGCMEVTLNAAGD